MCVHRSRSSGVRALVASAVTVAVAMALTSAPTNVLADASGAKGQRPDGLIVVHHSRGPRWDTEVGFRDQPGIRDHIRYYEALDADGQILLGGPFLDDTGGMMILGSWDSPEAVREIAMGDPAVEAGVLGDRVLPIPYPMLAEDPVQIEASKPDIRVVAWLSPGASWTADTPRSEQADMDAHAGFCRQQIDTGRWAVVAPDGNDGELVVFMPGFMLDSASELLATDPAIASGVLTTATTEWLIVFKLTPPGGSAE